MTDKSNEVQPGVNPEKKPAKDGRSYTWAAILYRESLPDNWLELLEEMMVPGFVSPEHTLDLNPDGEPKKPHFHLLLKFATKKSYSQVSGLLEPLNGSAPQRINDFRSYARYLCHLDNPSKAQYEREQVISLCGLVYDDVVGTSADRLAGIHEMMTFCTENAVYSFSDLLEYAAEMRRDWFRLLCDNSAHIMVEYLKSKTWTAETDKPELLKSYDNAIALREEQLAELEQRTAELQAQIAYAGGDSADALARRDEPEIDDDEILEGLTNDFNELAVYYS